MGVNFITTRLEKDREELSAQGIVGNNYPINNAHKIEKHYNINGSSSSLRTNNSKNPFGGAEKWPVVDAHIGFQEGEESKRDLFAEKLKNFIEDFFNKE